ncbi:MAG TPA: hypothetical protein VHS97_01215, partial [Isosphaeraceae bacterium]|nr:hypothetical protein [Isosphaeraceae bacterium]
FDAIDGRDVALVFLASFVLKGDKGQWYWEIAKEMTDSDLREFLQNAADREFELLKPDNASSAREALLGIIERATERLTLKAHAHRERAEVKAELAADILAFDDSPEGECLRRYELAHGRGVARAIDLRRKHRPTANQIDRNVATGTVAEFDILQQAHAITVENATIEPTAAHENVTSEPNITCENATIEPTLAADVGLESPTYIKALEHNVTIEPNDVGENLTNEPPFAGHGSDRESAELRTLADGSDDEHFHAEVDIEKASKWIREAVEKRQAIRADELRRLNEESRTEADAVAVVRRTCRRGMGIEQSESTPHVERKAGGIGKTSEEKMHPALHRLLTGRESTLLDMSPILGK